MRAITQIGRRGRALLGLLILALAASTAAWAYWSAPSNGSATGRVGALAAPTISSVTPGGGTVALSWTTVAAPSGGTVSYYVSRDGAAAGGNCPTSASPGSPTSCTDTGVAVGSHTYTVTAVWRSWTAQSGGAPAHVTSGAATQLVLTPTTATPTAGASDNLTITAEDAQGNTVASYTGTKSLTFSGAVAIGSHHPTVSDSAGVARELGSPESIAFSSGVASVSASSNGAMTLYRAETASVKVSDGTIGNGAGTSITVAPASAATLTVPTPSTQVAGGAFGETLTALDAYGNTATGFAGAKTIAFSGPGSSPSGKAPVYPASVKFNAGVSESFNVTLYDASASTTLSAAQGSAAGTTSSFTVNPASSASLSLSAASSTPAAGEADALTITALDSYGNTATSYAGNRNLTFGGAGAIGANKPTVSNSSGSSVAFGTQETISFSGGVAKASGSANGVMKLYAAEAAKVTATDGTIGTVSALAVTVSSGPASSISVTNPGTQTAGKAFNLTVNAKDAYGNGIGGEQSLTFSGPASAPDGTAPTYPSSPVSFSGGEGKAAVTLTKAQTTTITVKAGSASATSSSFTVNAGAASELSLSAADTTPEAGVSDNLTITALDSYANTATAFTGNKSLTFTGANAIGANKPTVSNSAGSAVAFGTQETISFSGGVAKASGSANGVMKLYAAEAAQIAVTGEGLSGSLPVTVSSGALSIAVANPGTQTAGAAFNLSITAKDAYGNTASGPLPVTFAGPESSPSEQAPSYPSQVNFTAGTGSASVTLYDAGSANVTVTIGSGSAKTNSFTVNPATATKLAWSGASSNYFFAEQEGLCLFSCTWSGLGRSHTWSAKVSVTDNYGNVVSNVGSGHTVTWTGGPSAGKVTPSSLALPASGTATTSSSVTYTSPNNNGWGSDTFTAHSSPYSDATVLLKQ